MESSDVPDVSVTLGCELDSSIVSPSIFVYSISTATISATPQDASSLLAIGAVLVEDCASSGLLAIEFKKELSTKVFEKKLSNEQMVELKT